jgi:hypothetical protein
MPKRVIHSSSYCSNYTDANINQTLYSKCLLYNVEIKDLELRINDGQV